jgi:hypothetical protein
MPPTGRGWQGQSRAVFKLMHDLRLFGITFGDQRHRAGEQLALVMRQA